MTWMNLKLFYDFDSWEIIMTLWSFSERLYGLINQYPAWDAVNFWRYKIVSQKSGQSVSLSLLIGEKSEKKSKSHLIASLPTHAKFTFRSEKYRKKNFAWRETKLQRNWKRKNIWERGVLIQGWVNCAMHECSFGMLFLSAAEPTYYCFEVIKYLDFLIPLFSRKQSTKRSKRSSFENGLWNFHKRDLE